jgi:hypothetical protein
MNACPEEALTGVNVANAHYAVPGQKELLSRDPATAAAAIEVLRIKMIAKGLNAQTAQQRVLMNGPLLKRVPQHGPEPSGVVIPKHSGLGLKIDMVVAAGLRSLDMKTESTRHTQMDDQDTVDKAQQQILATPLNRQHLLTHQSARQIGRHRPAQPRLAYLYGVYASPSHGLL